MTHNDTWYRNKNEEITDNSIRLVIHREGDNKSFFEATQRKHGEKRSTLHTTVTDMTDAQLIELRDHLNTLKLDAQEDSITTDMERVFKEGKIPSLETELEIWNIIEALGGISWNLNHEVADGRTTITSKQEEFMASAKRVQEHLIKRLETEYGIIPPDGAKPDQPAPEGKKYYWDWYEEMQADYFKNEYDKIICSACALHEDNGAEKMRICVPCDVFNGMIYSLIYPWECAMLTFGSSNKWTEEQLLAEIKAKGGEDSVKRYKQKLILLKGNETQGEE